MSKERLILLLEILCKFSNVHIEHTFGTNDQPLITVKCIKHNQIIEITYLESQTIKLFDNLEEAAEAIQQRINTAATHKPLK